MSFSHRIAQSVNLGGSTISKSKEYSASYETNISEAVADSATDFEIAFSADTSAVASFYLVSDQAVTLETNDGSSPDDTLVLVANVPYVFTSDSYDTFQFSSADITSIFATNASGSSANIQIYCLQDATPS